MGKMKGGAVEVFVVVPEVEVDMTLVIKGSNTFRSFRLYERCFCFPHATV